MSKQLKQAIETLKDYNIVFQVQYVDYQEGVWTFPQDLTAENLDKFLAVNEDESVRKIRLEIEKK